MSRYAQGTTVSIEKSEIEVRRVLQKYGATKFGTMVEPEQATIFCELKNRRVQIVVPMPTKKEKAWMYASPAKVDAERRRRWRVLLITLKAMLEAVESGLMSFDQAFLAFIEVPGTARTLGDELVPRLNALYAGASLKALLAGNPDE
jgi:hypothetical protein